MAATGVAITAASLSPTFHTPRSVRSRTAPYTCLLRGIVAAADNAAWTRQSGRKHSQSCRSARSAAGFATQLFPIRIRRTLHPSRAQRRPWEDSPDGVVWSAEDLARATGGELLALGSPGPVVTDTRSLSAGGWFLALRGDRYDGHDFLQEACLRGCAGVIVSSDPPPEWPHGVVQVPDTLVALHHLASDVRTRFKGHVVAITGSCGKTTTREMVVLIARQSYHVHSTSGNLNNHVGLPITLLRTPSTATLLVLELGMSARGEIAALAAICRPTIRVVTEVAAAHVEGVGGSLDAVAAAKAELLRRTSPGDVAVLNADNRRVGAGMPTPPWVRRATFGASPHATLRYASVSLHNAEGADGAYRTRFTLLLEGVRSAHEVDMECVGGHLPLCASAAATVGDVLGIPLSVAAHRLGKFRAEAMRMEVVQTPKGRTLLLDCYNANPTSIASALRLLAELPGVTQRVALLGDMGELGAMEEEAHREVLQLSMSLGLHAVGVTGDAFRRAAAESSDNVGPTRLLFADSPTALAQAIAPHLEYGAAVLVKGSRLMRMEAAAEALA